MSYDPDRKKRRKGRKGRPRKGIEPAGLKRWRLARKHALDPRRKGMAYGYGKVKGKPYRVDGRGGVAWSGATKPRYDPQRFARIRRGARRYGSKIEGIINKHAGKIGAGLAALIGIWSGIEASKDSYGNGYENYFIRIIGGKLKDGTPAPAEVMHLTDLDMSHPWNALNYLKYKFLGIEPLSGNYVGSSWVIPFWASLIGFVGAKITRYFKVAPPRITTPIEKISKGALITSTIGALVLPGSGENSTATSNPSYRQGISYVYGK